MKLEIEIEIGDAQAELWQEYCRKHPSFSAPEAALNLFYHGLNEWNWRTPEVHAAFDEMRSEIARLEQRVIDAGADAKIKAMAQAEKNQSVEANKRLRSENKELRSRLNQIRRIKPEEGSRDEIGQKYAALKVDLKRMRWDRDYWRRKAKELESGRQRRPPQISDPVLLRRNKEQSAKIVQQANLIAYYKRLAAELRQKISPVCLNKTNE